MSDKPVDIATTEVDELGGDGEDDISADDFKLDEDEYELFENDIILEDDISAAFSDITSQLPEEKATKSFKTTRFLTKYERTRVLGVRATQISRGAPPLIKLELNGRQLNDPREIAEQELLNRKLFFIIRRRLPSKVVHKPNYEYVHLNQLIL